MDAEYSEKVVPLLNSRNKLFFMIHQQQVDLQYKTSCN